MARTTAEDIIAILPDTTGLTETTIVPFMNSANVFVTEALEKAGLTDAILIEIEKYMAAHMATFSKDRVSIEEGAGGAYIKFAGSFGKGLSQTQYGQMCVILDISGTLEALQNGKSKATSFAVLGV